MNNLVTKNFNGSNIEFKVENGVVYANANKMAEAFENGAKKLENWKASENTKRYIDALYNSLKSSEFNLIQSKEGKNGGTWIHEKLVLNFARYLDVNFELWCDEQISTLLREGTVSVNKTLSPAQFLLQQAQLMVEMDERVNAVEKSVAKVEHNIRRTVTSNHLTVIAYANIKGIKYHEYNSSSVGKKATRICKEEGLQIGKVVDSKYGLINTYPEDVLDRIFFS
jgi:KilA-N domain.